MPLDCNAGTDDIRLRDGWQAQAPLVQRVFGGELASHVACQGCDHEAATAEPFLDISVSIPQAAAPDADRRAGAGLYHAA